MIALLCPTRGRPEKFKRMRESAIGTSVNNVMIYYCSNGEDSYAPHAPLDCPTVYMWNSLALKAKSDFNSAHKLFMLASDDTIFATPGWDQALLDHYDKLDNKIHVYSLKDSRDENGTPHPIVTREYIEAMGYFLPPIFMHWFVDTWIVDIARSNNCFTKMNDYLLIHDKPSDVGKSDETHSRIRSMGWHDRDVDVNSLCQHFLELEKKRLAHIISDQKLDKQLVAE